MVYLGAISKMTEGFKDRNIKATTDGMVKSVWQMTVCPWASVCPAGDVEPAGL